MNHDSVTISHFGDFDSFEALRRGLRRERQSRQTVERALAALPGAEADAELLRHILFDRPVRAPLLWCNAHVRTAGRMALVRIANEIFASDPHRQFYLVTTAGSRWVRGLRTPDVDLTALQRATDKSMRHRGLSGMFAFEFDIVIPDPDESDYPLAWHGHGIVSRLDGKPAGLKKLKKAFAASRAFPPWNDAVGLHITAVKRTPGDLARVLAYLCDPVHQLKLRYPDPKRPGRRKMRGTYRNFPPAVVLRGVELQSHINVFDTVFGVGPLGTAWRDQWRMSVREDLLVDDAGTNDPGVALDRIWERINAARPEWGFATPDILTRSRAYAERDMQGRQR
jgi:hypothetical protein